MSKYTTRTGLEPRDDLPSSENDKNPSISQSANGKPCPPVPGLMTPETWRDEATTLDTHSFLPPLQINYRFG